MDKDRILVVEDDDQTAAYLKVYFDWLGYDVSIVDQGNEVLPTCRLKMPDVIILDVTLPDVNGYEVCRTLRTNSRTNHIPIIFVSQRTKRNDIIAAFELGADDYITKPFDIEELKLRVEGVIRRSRHEALMHPLTNLPAGELIAEQLKLIKDSAEPWTLLYFSIGQANLLEMPTVGQVNQRVIDLAQILRQAVETYGSPNDFIGQASDRSFVVITMPETASVICKSVFEQFGEDRLDQNGATPLLDSLKLMVGTVSSYDGPFTDIKQIPKTLARLGVKPHKAGCPDETYGLPARADDIDYCNQLTEQAALWRTASELAQALLEVERLTAARIPDMHKIEGLLALSVARELPPETYLNLQVRQRLCRLAAENLNELQYKIRSYEEFKPVLLIETLQDTINLLPKAQITISPPSKSNSKLLVALPELKLQQAIYNVCRWLGLDQDEDSLVVSLEAAKEMASLIFTVAESKQARPGTAGLLKALNQNQPGVIYGYLAHKIVSRYGGRLISTQGRVTLDLPLARSGRARPSKVAVNALRQKIKEQRLFLDTQKRLTFPPHVVDKAANLIDPLAEDLLVEIEAMLAALGAGSGIVAQAYPWSALQRNYRFFRLLTLDLRKNRPLIPAPVNLKSVLENLKPMLAHRLLDHEIILESEIARPVINTDQTRLSQIFVHLTLNALEAMSEGGVLKFRIKQEGRYYVVEVIDNGPGIPQEDLEHIFNPHFTTKEAGRGMGLHHVKSYVKQLNGQLEVSSTLGQGTTFSVKLPPSWEAGYFSSK